MINILKSLIRSFRRFMPNFRIQSRLFFSSVIIIFLVILSLLFLSQALVTRLIVQKQSDFELNSFKQVNSFLRSVFTSTEGYIETLHKDSSFMKIFTENFDANDSIKTVSSLNVVENAINTVLINKEYMDNVIIIGENNFLCVYSQTEDFFTTRYLENVDFQTFCESSLLSGFINNSSSPFYFNADSFAKPSDSAVSEIQSLVDKKIIMVRKLENKSGFSDCIIIISFKTSIAANIIPASLYGRSVFLADNKEAIVWTNDSSDKTGDVIKKSKSLSSSTELYKSQEDGKEYLLSASNMEPYDFRIISRTPIKMLLGNNTHISENSIIFGVICLILAFVSSFYLLRTACRQLESLSKQLTSNKTLLPSKTEILMGNNFYSRLSLNSKLYVHFGISVVLPTVLFISFNTYLNYNLYKSKIIELTNNSIKQIKWNIDYKLANYDKFASQIIFDDNVQSAFYTNQSDEINNQIPYKISEVFLFKRIKNKELLSLNLYDLNRDNIYSSIPFDNFPITNINPDFQRLMNESKNALCYLGSSNDYLGLGPALLFARNMRSNRINFGKLLGYLAFSIDTDAMYSLFKNGEFGDSGQFFLMDKTGKIIPNGNSYDSQKRLENILNSSNFSEKTEGYFLYKHQKDNYLFFFNTLNNFGLKIIGMVPVNEIRSKLYPLIWYSILIFSIYLFMLLIVTFLISRGISKPLKSLEHLMEEMRNENFNVHMEYTGKDEIAILSENFNLMVDRLNQLIEESFRSKLRESELMFLEKEAQFNALQQQINPHFLYNTLESIKWMAYKIDATDIINMTTALGKFFRGAITKSNDFVSFQQEIDHLENYIYIQKIRYQGKFDVALQISDEVRNHKTIKLILQPLVENALIHGLESIKQGGLITIHGYKSDGFINFEILDNGIGISQKALEKLQSKIISSEITSSNEKSSIGISNVYRRLKLYFGDSCKFEISSMEGKGTNVRFSIPLVHD